MTPTLPRRAAGALALALVLASGGCQAASSGGGAAPGGGISAEEYESLSPTAPVDVRARTEDGAVVVRWSPPPPPSPGVRPLYDPRVRAYRVWRIGPDHVPALVGETPATSLRIPGGRGGTFAVTTVTVSGHESGLSLEASAP